MSSGARTLGRPCLALTGARDAAKLLLMAQSGGEPTRREHAIRTCPKCGARVVGRRLAPCCLEPLPQQ